MGTNGLLLDEYRRGGSLRGEKEGKIRFWEHQLNDSFFDFRKRKKSADMSALNAGPCRPGIILCLAAVLLASQSDSGKFFQRIR